MEYLRTDTVSVGTLYRKDAKLSRGAGAYFCKHFVPAGAQGGGHLPTLPLRCSQGGLPSLPPAYPAFPDATGGGLGGFGRLPALPLVCFLSPIPPPPFPAGRGRIKVILCKGLRPLHPRGLNPCGTGSPCPGGEDHLKRRSSSPPVPLSLAAGAANREPLPIVFAANRKLPAWGARMAEAVSAAGGSVQGRRGR